MSSHGGESYYFILPARKLPTVRFQRSALVKCALVLVLIVVMAIVALSLGILWDSLTPLSNPPVLRVLSE
jgi:hypothetical protein